MLSSVHNMIYNNNIHEFLKLDILHSWLLAYANAVIRHTSKSHQWCLPEMQVQILR